MKPDNAIKFICPPMVCEAAIQDAMNMMLINLCDGECSLVVTVGGDYLFYAADISNRMSRDVINLTMKTKYDPMYSGDEWSLDDLSTGKCVWASFD